MRQRVSVLITCYNYGRYLAECLESVIAQTRPPEEIVVVDDGSTDDTPEVAKRYPTVRYVRQENAGYGGATNRAVAESTGDILLHLDADDYLFPTKVQKILEAFERYPRLGGVIHDVVHIDAKGTRIASLHRSGQFPAEVFTLENTEACGFLYRLPQVKTYLHGNPTTIATRREAIADLFPVPGGPAMAMDGVFLCGALRTGVYYIPEALAAYRRHEANLWRGNPYGERQIIRMWEYLVNHPTFRNSLTYRHADMFRAAILERKAFIASRTGEYKLDAALGAMRIPFLTLKHGRLCSWKHLALPFICVLPVKRSPRAGKAKRSPGLA